MSGTREASDGFEAYTLRELQAKVNAEFRERREYYDDGVIADSRWNGWRFYPGERVLVWNSNEYEVDLAECSDSAKVLDWIIQVSGKGWVIAEVLAGLIYALDDILHLQATVCGSGLHHTLTSGQIKQLAQQYVHGFHAGEVP